MNSITLISNIVNDKFTQYVYDKYDIQQKELRMATVTEMEAYKLTCKGVSIEFTRECEGGIETITNLNNGHQMTRFEDWKLFQAFLQLAQDYGIKVEKYDILKSI